MQDYKSTYNDIRDWVSKERENREQEKQLIDWEEVVFEVDLLKSQEIDLDYILELIDRKSTRLNSSHGSISYAVFCLKKKKCHKPQ